MKDKKADKKETNEVSPDGTEIEKKEVKEGPAGNGKKDVFPGAGKSAGPSMGKFRNKRKAAGVVIAVVVGIAVILGLSTLIGIYIVPKAQDWLADRGILESSEEENGGTSVTGSREVVSETNWVIDVVEQSKTGVVSIAISEVSLDPQLGTVADSANIGTGFVIDDTGLVLTNQHVVSDQGADYVVVSWDGEEHEVVEIARDDVNDLAILRIEGDGLEALPLGDSSALKVGQMVVAIGTPLGDLPGTVTTGIVSGLGRSVTASSGGFWGTTRTYEDVIQTDAAVNPGNSGGPLLDAAGNVIGINFATTSGADNISFAIPIDRAKERIDEYNTYGKFIKPYLGVEYQLISRAEAMFYQNVVPGALVKRVVPGSPADKAGVEPADIITKIDDTAVVTSFSGIIQGYQVGDEVELEIWRNSDFTTVTAVLEEAE
jgi:S1-C subfamily serine protease